MPADRSAQIVESIAEAGLIAVIRTDSSQLALETCRALAAGGVRVQEIALTTPNGVEAIRQAAAELPDCLIGAGTVLTPEQANAVVDAGASFVFAPNTDPAVIETAKSRGVAAVPGALTPTEIATAISAGADVVKLFPANYFGPRYIKDIHGPLPGVRITPTGGINLENLGEWLSAGAIAVGVGTSMVRKDLIREGRWEELATVASRYVEAVAEARGGLRIATA